MKTYLFSFIVVLVNTFGVQENTTEILPMLFSKFEIANYEISNLDKASFSEYLFKEKDCETDSYSFFSPFYLYEDLVYAKFDADSKEDKVDLSITYNYAIYKYSISDIVISEDQTRAEINITKDNTTYQTILHGSNLSLEGILASFSNIKDHNVIQPEACPPCAIIIAVIVAEIISDVCKNAQNACGGCSGNLTVGACSCINYKHCCVL